MSPVLLLGGVTVSGGVAGQGLPVYVLIVGIQCKWNEWTHLVGVILGLSLMRNGL